MGKNTSISLGSHFEQFIMSKVDSGRFQSASEVVRAGLRLLEEEEQRFARLNKALEEGEASGLVHDFDPEEFLKSMKKKYAQK